MKRILLFVFVAFFAQSLLSQVIRDLVPRDRVVMEVATDATG